MMVLLDCEHLNAAEFKKSIAQRLAKGKKKFV
jgi:hypothetical protein